jgi:hypothetical protein
MFPGFAACNKPYAAFTDSVLFRDDSVEHSGGCLLTNISDLYLSEARASVRFAFGALLNVCNVSVERSSGGSSFGSFVRHVIGVGAEKQMIGADAWGIVALVAHEQPYGNRPKGKHPCNFVSDDIPCLEPKLNIAASKDTARTNPTGAKFGAVGRGRAVLVYLRPKTILKGWAGVYSTCHRKSPSVSVPPAVCISAGAICKGDYT